MGIVLLKACKYCGRIHTFDFCCTAKPKSNYIRNEEIVRFRNSREWKIKREDIRKRDCGCCVACFHNLPGTLIRINTVGLSVHHIKSLINAWELRLQDDNLITLCEHHHKAAEKGTISAQMLLNLVKKEVKIPPGGFDF